LLTLFSYPVVASNCSLSSRLSLWNRTAPAWALVVLSRQECQKRDQARRADHNHRSPDAAAGRWLLNRLVPYRSQYRQT
jgi:hypothetical protein